MFQSNKTTGNIIKPLLKMIEDLEAHVENQTGAVAQHNAKIEHLIAELDFKHEDIKAAHTVLSNVRAIVGGSDVQIKVAG